VIIVAAPGARRLAYLETAFYNLSIKRLYYLCKPITEADFGEDQASVDTTGSVRDAAGPLEASYAVVTTRFRVRGSVVARDRRGSLLLVRLESGRLTVRPGARDNLRCRR
jgi:hypothetical protein